MGELNQIWAIIAPYFAGVTFTSVVSAVIFLCLKTAFNKIINKIDVERIANKATDKGIEKVKQISFIHSIQPIVESELKKINEQASEIFRNELKQLQTQYDNLIDVIEKLSAYFDNSIISDGVKQDLKDALNSAKNKPTTAESVIIEELAESTPKQANEPQEKAKNDVNVVR